MIYIDHLAKRKKYLHIPGCCRYFFARFTLL